MHSVASLNDLFILVVLFHAALTSGESRKNSSASSEPSVLA
jgi:hypothetical protein